MGKRKIFYNSSITGNEIQEQFLCNKNWKYIWTKNGIVHLRKNEEATSFQVRNEQDIVSIKL